MEFMYATVVKFKGRKALKGAWDFRLRQKDFAEFSGRLPQTFGIRLVRANGFQINLASVWRNGSKLNVTPFPDVIGGQLQLAPVPRPGDRLVAREIGADGKVFYTFRTF